MSVLISFSREFKKKSKKLVKIMLERVNLDSIIRTSQQKAFRITQCEIDSMSGYSPAHERHLAYLHNNTLELQNQEDMLNERQSNNDQIWFSKHL